MKGDVHDIGKNIVSVVLSCNHYDIIDLGVMVPAGEIVRRAKEDGADIIGLSGLITPSLEEMAHVASELEKAGLRLPLLIGGATTSPLHTALKIAPAYSGPVIYARDASQVALIAGKLMNPSLKAGYVDEVNREYARLREEAASREKPKVSLEEARRHRLHLEF